MASYCEQCLCVHFLVLINKFSLLWKKFIYTILEGLDFDVLMRDIKVRKLTLKNLTSVSVTGIVSETIKPGIYETH